MNNTIGKVSFEPGLRTFMRKNKNNRNWRVVLRIDWETGAIDVRRVHNTEGTSFRTYRRFQSEWTLSEKLTNASVRVLVGHISDSVENIRNGWRIGTDGSQNAVGMFNDYAWTAWGWITEQITVANDWADEGYDSRGYDAGRA